MNVEGRLIEETTKYIGRGFFFVTVVGHHSNNNYNNDDKAMPHLYTTTGIHGILP